jgi:hypothetical protein
MLPLALVNLAATGAIVLAASGPLAAAGTR